MKKIKVDAMGDQCPIPVIKTKKALKEITETTLVEVHVDNEIAVQNLSKMAKQKNLEYKCEKGVAGIDLYTVGGTEKVMKSLVAYFNENFLD